MEIWLEGRLGCRTQNRTYAIVPRQFGDRSDTDLQEWERKHLCFIEDHNAVGDVVQFATASRFAGKQGLEELHSGRYNNGCIPVFTGQMPTIGFFRTHIFIIDIAVVLQYVLVAQKTAEDCRVLFDDAGVGDDINDPLLAVDYCVFQCEGH